MTEFNWKNQMRIWISTKKTTQSFQKKLINFFQTAFENTSQPEKSLFGTTSSSISIVVGGIYLASIHSGKTISLLLDKKIEGLNNTKISIAKSTENFEAPFIGLKQKT